MLPNDFLPPFVVNGLPLHTQWFMQDGVVPHIANIVLHLNTVFGPCVMSIRYPDRHNCGNSPDLNPCDFFLWGFLKEVFPHKPFTELKMTGMLAEFAED